MTKQEYDRIFNELAEVNGMTPKKFEEFIDVSDLWDYLGIEEELRIDLLDDLDEEEWLDEDGDDLEELE